MMKLLALGALAAGVSAHSSLIYPKPRNAIDSLLPEWSGGKAPYRWEKVKSNPVRRCSLAVALALVRPLCDSLCLAAQLGDYPCACVNGTEPCESAQTCLWFSVGCTLGCSECDGGSKGGSNPNRHDRCGNGTGKATINDPM